MIDLHTALQALAVQRPVFHSEADFQHALAWTVQQAVPNAALRLERPVSTSRGLLHVDFVASMPGELLVCELKYKTWPLQCVAGDEKYDLRGHAAQPIGRYDFLTDVARLEAARVALAATSCWAILLTNDSVYWTAAGSATGVGAAFSLSPGRHCTGSLDWGPNASPGTKRGREKPITLTGQYCFEWRDYSQLEVPSSGRFRYLAVEVGVGSGAVQQRDAADEAR